MFLISTRSKLSSQNKSGFRTVRNTRERVSPTLTTTLISETAHSSSCFESWNCNVSAPRAYGSPGGLLDKTFSPQCGPCSDPLCIFDAASCGSWNLYGSSHQTLSCSRSPSVTPSRLSSCIYLNPIFKANGVNLFSFWTFSVSFAVWTGTRPGFSWTKSTDFLRMCGLTLLLLYFFWNNGLIPLLFRLLERSIFQRHNPFI